MSSTSIEIMDSSDVARLLKCSVRTVQRMAGRGEIPYVKKGPGPNGSYIFDGYAIRQIAANNR